MESLSLTPDAQIGQRILTQNNLATYSGLSPDTPIFWDGEDRKPTTLAHAMKHEPAFTGYAFFLSSQLGQDSCLDAAMICLFSAVGSARRLGRAAVNAACMPQYALALQRLRSAMETGDLASRPEIGYLAAAVFLIAAYESAIMRPTWKTHISGLAALYKMAGPSRIISHFDRAILLASAGSSIEVAIAENHHCFLALPEWQSLLYAHLPVAIGQPSIFTHTRLFMSCWTAVPGLLHDCRKIMDNPSESSIEEIDSLLAVAWKVRRDLLGNDTIIPTTQNPSDQHDYQWFMANQNEQNTGNYATFLLVHAITARVIISLESISKAQEDLMSLEQQCRDVAQEIVDLYARFSTETELSSSLNDLAPVDPGTRFRFLHVRYATAVLQTHDVYAEHVQYPQRRSGQMPQSHMSQVLQRIISPWIFCSFHDKLRGVELQ